MDLLEEERELNRKTKKKKIRKVKERNVEFVNGINNIGQIWKQQGEAILVTKRAVFSLGYNYTVPYCLRGTGIFYLTCRIYGARLLESTIDISTLPPVIRLLFPLNFSLSHISFDFISFTKRLTIDLWIYGLHMPGYIWYFTSI